MITIRRQLMGLGFVAASSLLALQSAHAMTGPTAITIDGGPVGSLSLSGGVDGYGYYFNNAPASTPAPGNTGIFVGNALVELQKSSGVLQFTIEVGSTGGTVVLGTRPAQTTVNFYRTGPLYLGYVTIAPPNSPVTVSAGHVPSLEGYEATPDWSNPSQLATSLFFVQNSSSTGVMVAGTEGPVTATVVFGDGWDTGVWNTVQALVSYTINSSNVLNVYGTANLGRTGPGAFLYGCGGKGADICSAGTGNAYLNSDMIGAYYSFTAGNLNLVPEVQYVSAKTDYLAGIPKTVANFGAALFSTYSFANTPYSIGGWVEYENSQGNYNWFVGPESEAMGAAISPTWQYKDLFARANAGAIYLLNNKAFSTASYGNDGTAKVQFTGTLEAGLLF
jgi:Putative beta-barrel porin-2, OmpL-like. bbp2